MDTRTLLKSIRNPKTRSTKLFLIIAAVFLVSYLLGSFIFGEMGLIKYYRMQSQHDALTEEISSLKRDNAKLMSEVQSLKADPDYLERVARDKLGLARKGEIVYYYGDP